MHKVGKGSEMTPETNITPPHACLQGAWVYTPIHNVREQAPPHIRPGTPQTPDT